MPWKIISKTIGMAEGGSLHALKGSCGPGELEVDRDELTRLGAASCSVNHFGAGIVDPETVVVSVTVSSVVHGRRAPKRPAHDHRRRD